MKLIVLFLLSLHCPSAFSQQQTMSEKELFESGLNAYRSKSFHESRNKFETMTKTFPDGELYTAGVLMLAKTYEKIHYYKKAIAAADQLIASYPESSYADDALFVRARSLYELNDYGSAIRDLSQIKKHTTGKPLYARADSLIRRLVQNKLSSVQIATMLSLDNDPELQAVLQYQYVSNMISLKRYERTKGFIETLSKKNLSSSQFKTYRDILKQIANKEEGPVRIGFITSLTGSNSEIGKSVKAGVELAVQTHNKTYKPLIELSIFDDQSDIIQAILAARELTADDGIAAIIGPLESNTMAAAAVIADQRHIPIISPTATQSGLIQIGAYVYQANVNIESRSEAIARYAIEVLGYKTFAILSPSDPYGDIASTAFAKSVEKLGGRMIVFEKFYDNTTDFKGQLIHLRKMGFIDRALRNSSFRFLSALTPFQIDSIYARYYPLDSAAVNGEYNLPMESIDALFLPVYTDDIKYIAPQLAFYNIKTNLLGGDNWYDLTELRLHQNYIHDLFFVSESFMDPQKAEVKAFQEAFKKMNGKEPAREAAYGFDLMNMLASLVQSGNYSADEFQAELQKGLTWNGVHNKIVLSKDFRVNSSVHILQFSKGQIKKLTE